MQLNALEKIFRAGVKRVDPEKLIHQCVRLSGDMFTVATGEDELCVDLSRFERIIVIGFGKATARMAMAVESILGDRIDGGLISVKYGYGEALSRVQCIEAGHPIPDENGMAAAQKIAEIARRAGEKSLVLTLISGGGSALVPLPFSSTAGDERVEIRLEEKQAVTQVLLECGAVINEINCLRKHLSNIKGGRLAQMLYPATSVNLILSDVVGDQLDAIASGPTTWDNTSFFDVAKIVEKYDIEHKLPEPVRRVFSLGGGGLIPDTPKKNDMVFEKASNVIVGSNYQSLLAAAKEAETLGFCPVILSSQIAGEAREVARVYCGIGKDAKRKAFFGRPPLCLIAGGETTVTIRGSGKGGRNQEMALAFLDEMQQNPEATAGLYFLAASTDGNDGPTDAAGAFACAEILDTADRKGLKITEYLKNNDAYSFFEATGHLLKTGPTNTNVGDIQLLLIP